MYVWWKIQMFAMFVVFAVVALALTIGALSSKGPPAAFALLWCAALVWNAYWFLWRMAFELELDGEVMRWQVPLRKGQLKVANITEVRPSKFGSSAMVMKMNDGSSLLVMVRKGLSSFTDVLQSARPDLSIRLGRYSRIAESMPGWSGFGPDDGR